jgi:NagD protein
MPTFERNNSELKEKKAFFFDLDGTIYLGNKVFEGVHELIKLLQERNKKFYFLSNNSSKSTSDYLLKLKKLNLDASRENIILSQHPTIDYLKKEGYQKIFLMGNKSL